MIKNTTNKINPFTFLKSYSVNEVSEGVGAKVKRSIGVKECQQFDPFLMLDHFKVKLPNGFPDHPHRGFETVTYMFTGEMHHEDFKGHKGVIKPGDIQWMTAGKGIVHSEIPGSFEEYSTGLQLWINLNKENKMVDPIYQEFSNKTISQVKSSSGKSIIKVISGKYNEVEGPVKSLTSVHYYDINLDKDDNINIKVNKGKVNIFIYVYEDNGLIVLENNVKCINAAMISKDSDNEEYLELKANKQEGSKFVLLLGHPLNEPVAKHGPFVMNYNHELEKTFNDYKNGENGFEGAQEWQSKIKEIRNKK